MNLNPLFPLMLGEVEELAGCLATSSTIERYVRCLKASTGVKRLVAELKSARIDGRALLRYAWFYRAQILQDRVRSEWELPLAAITVVLGQSGVVDTEHVLKALATAEEPQFAWLSALSRRLLATRSSSQIETSPVQTRRAQLRSVIVRNRGETMLLLPSVASSESGTAIVRVA